MTSSSLHPGNTWFCIRLTHLALNSVSVAVDAEQPAAISCQHQIWQCNHAAQRLGIQAGMSVNHALMLSADLEVLDRNPEKEAEKLTRLSHWAYRFTSMVSIYNDHTLLLEIGKSISLFKSLEHINNLINNDLFRFKIAASYGVSDTPKSAYVASFMPNPRLHRHIASELIEASIEHLDIDHKTITQLHNCGFDTLGDLQTIPGPELGARFGKALLNYLDQFWGLVPDPQTAVTPPETFHASVDFAEPIHNLQWIEQQLSRLLTDLAQFLVLRQLVCRSFTWRFYLENNRLLKTVTIGISSRNLLTSTDKAIATFEQLTQLKLASIQLDGAFSSIELSSTQLVPITLFNDDLFDPSPDTEQLNQLLDKLSNRLGPTALFRVTPEPEHLPELANGRRSALQTTSTRETRAQYTNNQILHDEPLWLLEQPQRLGQQAQQPLLDGSLNIIHGPQRISSHWWAKLQSRDYFIARQRNGRLVWIFYDRSNRQWYLHGLFA